MYGGNTFSNSYIITVESTVLYTHQIKTQLLLSEFKSEQTSLALGQFKLSKLFLLAKSHVRFIYKFTYIFKRSRFPSTSFSQ